MKKQVLRYLGYKNQVIDSKLNELIDECIEETREVCEARYIYKEFDIEIHDSFIQIIGTNLKLVGDSIIEHLSNSQKCMLMAVTVGLDIEKKINIYKSIDMTKSIILDACATAYIEEVCDKLEKEIGDNAKKENKNITWRFSPGYGDLSIDIQRKFLDILDANKKIGLTVSKHNLLFPRKSVTAIIGFVDDGISVSNRSCLTCNLYENCRFRKEGSSCGS